MTTHSSLALLEEKMFGKRNPAAKKSASSPAPVLCEKTDPLYHSIAVCAIDGCQVYVCHHCATTIDGLGTSYYDVYEIKRNRKDLDESTSEYVKKSPPMAILRKICRPCYRKCSV